MLLFPLEPVQGIKNFRVNGRMIPPWNISLVNPSHLRHVLSGTVELKSSKIHFSTNMCSPESLSGIKHDLCATFITSYMKLRAYSLGIAQMNSSRLGLTPRLPAFWRNTCEVGAVLEMLSSTNHVSCSIRPTPIISLVIRVASNLAPRAAHLHVLVYSQSLFPREQWRRLRNSDGSV